MFSTIVKFEFYWKTCKPQSYSSNSFQHNWSTNKINGTLVTANRNKLNFIVLLLLTLICRTPVVASAENAIIPLPPAPNLDSKKVLLGEKLFNDTILSGNRSKSCASCHILSSGGDDNQQFSRTTLGELRTINTPTVFNASHNFKYSIVGSITSLKTFFRDKLFGRGAMNNTWPVMIESLSNDNAYNELFRQIYSDGVTQENILDVLLSFQHTLVTPDSRFDQFLRGETSAITEQEKRGYHLFISYGCIACHQGKNIGGNLNQKLGLFEDFFDTSNPNFKKTDFGLFKSTQQERDKFYFRVPSLRNVAVTAPYLHDGSVKTLDKMIHYMGLYQLARRIEKDQRLDIAAFLGSLTGVYKNRYLDEN